MKSAECPTCGQRMLVRHGERFTVQESDLLSLIENVTKGRGGITMESIVTSCFPHKGQRQGAANARSVIWNINEKLVSTEYQIVGPGIGNKGGEYKFLKVSK